MAEATAEGGARSAGPARTTRSTRSTRLGVLLSGRGSNFLAIHEAIGRNEVPAEIAVVISDRPEAPGLARARDLGLRAQAIPRREPSGDPLSREAHEDRVLAALDEVGVDWICLAGYMRLLSPRFVTRYPRRILNIHPSLLPAFPGLRAQAQAVEHGVRVSGCTVHLVDEGLDSGPIVVQRCVAVAGDDSVDSLAARILAEEHRAYPEALRRLLTEPWRIEGRRLIFDRRTPRQTGDGTR
jgi:phosphoribosylglycinamide formyltransferase-1